MLVLIAGVTGNLGSRLAKVANSRGLSVRGLGRDPSKLDTPKIGALESFVQSESYYDIAALDKAVAGVDAVICAYSPNAFLDLEGHILLFRAAERAGIEVFLASSWGHPWTQVKFGDYEHYDPHIAFEQQVAMTSSVRPVYMNTGVFTDLLYTPYGPGGWDVSGANPKIQYWGEGNAQKLHWSHLNDVADWTIDLLFRNDVQEGKGGFFNMQSGASTLEEIASTWERVTGTKVDLVREGSLKDLEVRVAKARAEKGRGRYIEYIQDATSYLHTKGLFAMDEFTATRHPERFTTLEETVRERTQNAGEVAEYINSLTAQH